MLPGAVLSLVALAGCGSDGGTGAPEGTQVIGLLRAVQSAEPANVEEFLHELAAGGLVEGENLRVLGSDPAEVHPDPADATSVVRDWVSQGADLIVALSSSGAMTAAAAAPGTKVLFLSNDPTAVGLIENERRPEGQLTGLTFRVPADRTLELARRAVPGADTMGLLYPSNDPAARSTPDAMRRAAQDLALTLVTASFATPEDIGGAVESLRAQGADCILLANAPTTVRNLKGIGAALAAAPLPVVANTDTDLALLVLEPDGRELYRQMGRQAVRLLEGTPVSDVPVEDPARFRVVVNAGVAARLAIELPAELVRTADRVLAG